jgi:hypothetical protein
MVAASGLAVGMALAPGAPASAHPITGSWNDDGHVVGQASKYINSGDLVSFWQSILWADGKLASTASIDGHTGPQTHNATRAWQGSEQIGVDGVVGPQSWGRAQVRAQACGGDLDPNTGYFLYTYCGTSRTFDLRQQQSTGQWSFRSPRTSAWTGTNHGS